MVLILEINRLNSAFLTGAALCSTAQACCSCPAQITLQVQACMPSIQRGGVVCGRRCAVLGCVGVECCTVSAQSSSSLAVVPHTSAPTRWRASSLWVRCVCTCIACLRQPVCIGGVETVQLPGADVLDHVAPQRDRRCLAPRYWLRGAQLPLRTRTPTCSLASCAQAPCSPSTPPLLSDSLETRSSRLCTLG
jgi:hypothetical protein